MAKKPAKSTDLPTRQRVLQYAAELRDRAERCRDLNVRQRMYAPSKEAASRECSKQTALHGKELGPQKALEVLARRAFEAERAIEDAEVAARESRRRLVIAQSVANGERDAVRSGLSLGQRLDAALLALGLASEARTVQLDADRVRGDKEWSPPRTSDAHGDLESEARALVERVEARAQRARRLLVEEPIPEVAA